MKIDYNYKINDKIENLNNYLFKQLNNKFIKQNIYKNYKQ